MNLPPLPEPMVYPPHPMFGKDGTYIAEQMREYAAAAIEAYKASLKPVAWMKQSGKKTNPANPAVVCDGAKQLLYVVGNARADDYSIPLYRLDDQP